MVGNSRLGQFSKLQGRLPVKLFLQSNLRKRVHEVQQQNKDDGMDKLKATTLHHSQLYAILQRLNIKTCIAQGIQ